MQVLLLNGKRVALKDFAVFNASKKVTVHLERDVFVECQRLKWRKRRSLNVLSVDAKAVLQVIEIYK